MGYDVSIGSMVPAATASSRATTPLPSVDASTVRVLGERDRAANWFYWIAALSIVNTVLMLLGSSIGFANGLGLTEYIAGFVSSSQARRCSGSRSCSTSRASRCSSGSA